VPAFSVKLVGSVEDLPGQLVSFDCRTSAFETQPGNLEPDEVFNRATPSRLLFERNDRFHAPWFNAKKNISAPARDPAAMEGQGGLNFSASQNMLLSKDNGFPFVPAGSYTIIEASDFTPSTHGQLFWNDYQTFGVSLGNGATHLEYTDSAGTHDTGVASPSGKHMLTALFDHVGNTATFFKEGEIFAAGAYADTALGGVNESAVTVLAGGNSNYFVGKLGYFGLWKRVLKGLELDFVMTQVGSRFGIPGYLSPFSSLLYGLSYYVPPTIGNWLDPANGTVSSRINSVVGHPQKYARFIRPVRLTKINALVIPLLPDGSLDQSTDFVARFLEWPLDGIRAEPPILQDSFANGVCRLTLEVAGHYLFQLRRPGGGAVNVPFDVTIA
jgi:hypothetical protein